MLPIFDPSDGMSFPVGDIRILAGGTTWSWRKLIASHRLFSSQEISRQVFDKHHKNRTVLTFCRSFGFLKPRLLFENKMPLLSKEWKFSSHDVPGVGPIVDNFSRSLFSYGDQK